MIIVREIDAEEETKAAIVTNIYSYHSNFYIAQTQEYQHYKEHYPALIINPLHTLYTLKHMTFILTYAQRMATSHTVEFLL